jgi:hypothetical protein
MKRGFHQINNPVAAFHVALFSKKMDQNVPTLGDFVNARGNISQSAFGTNIIKIDWKKPGKLFGQVINRTDTLV